MQLSGLLLSMAVMVPPGELVEDHTQPYHWDQPTIRRFERREDDNDRRQAWNGYVLELEDLWREYRQAGSTPRAWRKYKREAGIAKRGYVYGDRYLAPVTP